MKSIFIAFKQLVKQVINDSVLIIILLGPILMGLFFKLVIPLINEFIIKKYIGFNDLNEYYQIIDILLYTMISLLICFIPAMVVLEEIDDTTSKYLMVTPLSSIGYLTSRIVLPSIIAFIMTVIIGYFCSLTDISFAMLLELSLLTTIQALILTFLIVCIAKNKVEGMAICKMTSIFTLGMFVPYFITNNYQYIVCMLPSFWIAKFAIAKNLSNLLLGLAVSFVWICVLYRRFRRKILK